MGPRTSQYHRSYEDCQSILTYDRIRLEQINEMMLSEVGRPFILMGRSFVFL